MISSGISVAEPQVNIFSPDALGKQNLKKIYTQRKTFNGAKGPHGALSHNSKCRWLGRFLKVPKGACFRVYFMKWFGSIVVQFFKSSALS